MARWHAGAAAAAILLASRLATAATASEPGTPAWAEGADVVEHLGSKLPVDPRSGARFTDAQGRPAALRELFDGVHPVLLVLAYYQCPQLCSLVLESAAKAMHQLDAQGFRLGAQYRVATISFDATEHVDQAARKQTSMLATLDLPRADGRPGAVDPAMWPFFIGDNASIRALTERLGFRFLRDPKTGALAHAAVVFVLTPDGTISRYLYGIDYAPRDLRLALLEASEGKTGSLGDKILLRCFEYDPATRRYGLFVSRFMQLGGLVILLVVAAMLSGFVRYELRRARGDRAP